MLEENLRRTLYLSDGSLAIFFETPLTATLSIICITLWILTLTKSVRSGTSNLNQSG